MRLRSPTQYEKESTNQWNANMYTKKSYYWKAAAVSLCLAGLAEAAVFVSGPANLWPDGVVYYRMLDDLKTIGLCEDSDPVVYCDLTNPWDACSQFVACIPLLGRCVDATEVNWGNGECVVDADCASGTCNVLSGRCINGDTPGFVSCDQQNPIECTGDEQCLAPGVANMCIAMKYWQAVANLTFIEFNCSGGVPSCPGNLCIEEVPDHHITFRLTTESSSSDHIGRNDEGSQTVVIREDGSSSWGLAHELGHALAFHHEMQRSDRGNYIDIDYDLIKEGKEGNYNVAESGFFYPKLEHGYADPFDFDSLMMYPLCTFSTCEECDPTLAGCRPIDLDEPWASDWAGMEGSIGQRSHFSDLDALVASFLYPEPDWRFVDWTTPGGENGTYLRPHDTFAEGAAGVPGGGVLWIQPGNYSAVGTYGNSMTVRAPIGPVTLGD